MEIAVAPRMIASRRLPRPAPSRAGLRGTLALLLVLGGGLCAPPADAQTSPLTIQPSTNSVGIRNPNPSEALDVTGTVKATAFVGDGSQLTGIATGGKLLLSAGATLPADFGTLYHGLFGTAWSSAESQIAWISPVGGTVSTLYVYDALGNGQSLTITLRKNGVDQPLACTIGANQTTCNNTANAFEVAAGDQLSLKSVSVGSLATQNRRFSASMLLTLP
jgi:hypothetical protein